MRESVTQALTSKSIISSLYSLHCEFDEDGVYEFGCVLTGRVERCINTPTVDDASRLFPDEYGQEQ